VEGWDGGVNWIAWKDGVGADVVERTAQAGSPLRFWAADKVMTAASARMENFILSDFVATVW
jgi:hypothetical protein